MKIKIKGTREKKIAARCFKIGVYGVVLASVPIYFSWHAVKNLFDVGPPLILWGVVWIMIMDDFCKVLFRYLKNLCGVE